MGNDFEIDAQITSQTVLALQEIAKTLKSIEGAIRLLPNASNMLMLIREIEDLKLTQSRVAIHQRPSPPMRPTSMPSYGRPGPRWSKPEGPTLARTEPEEPKEETPSE